MQQELFDTGGYKTVGNWQIRNFHGYHQSREGGVGEWQFHISGFNFDNVHCTVLMYDGTYDCNVPIDKNNRIFILGKWYGWKYWNH